MNKYKFNYDYSKTLWMKMFLAKPDFEKKISHVYINYEQAFEIVKAVDSITQGIKKIIYLVGWQGLGHDDCYPEMHTLNEFLKRDCDKTAKESLLWLIEESKKYNTVISFHGNLADEYSDNESHKAIVEANAVCNGVDGTPAVIEIFNGRNAYKISYKQYYESGIFKELWDKFMDAVPVREAGTVHLDNFCIAESLNPETFVEEQDAARAKMLDYITRECGIDVTTEYTYREAHFRAEDKYHPIRNALYSQSTENLPVCEYDAMPIRTLGTIPASWWTSNMSMDDCMNIPASVYSGHLTKNAQRNVFYGTMHGEDIWSNHGNNSDDWGPYFIKEFCTLQVPYSYLNRYDRLTYEEDMTADEDGRYTVYFSEKVVSCGKDCSIKKDGITLKYGNDVLLPVTEENNIFVAYSENGRYGEWNIPDADFSEADIFEITPYGNKPLGKAEIQDCKIYLDIKPEQAVAIYKAK